MNKFIFLLILLFCIPFSLAEYGQVIVFDLLYDQGDITELNRTILSGFLPEEGIVHDDYFFAELKNEDGEVLDTVYFPPPNELFIDGTNEEGNLEGGRILLDQSRFSVAVPFLPSLDSVTFSSHNKETSETVNVSSTKKNFSFTSYLSLFLGVLFLILGAFLWYKKH